MHTDELVAPAEPDAVSVADAVQKHTGSPSESRGTATLISRVAALDLFSKVSIFSLTITRKRCAYQACLSPFPVAPVSLPAGRLCLIEQALDKSVFAAAPPLRAQLHPRSELSSVASSQY